MTKWSAEYLSHGLLRQKPAADPFGHTPCQSSPSCWDVPAVADGAYPGGYIFQA